MNIFQRLGLPENHRKLSNKVTQLVKHWDEVVPKHKEDKRFVTQIKRDGVCSLTIIQDGAVWIYSRTGKAFTNTSELTKKIIQLDMRDGVYMGEMWVPKDVLSLEQLSGIVNPNRVNPLDKEYSVIPYQLQMSWFDVISIESFIKGTSDTKFERRHANLTERYDKSVLKFGLMQHPDIDVLNCVPVVGVTDIDYRLDMYVSRGEEGLVIRNLDADWEAGHKGWRVMKKVKGVDYDLECIGYEVGTGKYADKVANLLFKWRGMHSIKCMLGKGWTHAMAKDMLDNIKIGITPMGKIFQVYALEESSKGLLRLPKVGEQRFDKDFPDQL